MKRGFTDENSEHENFDKPQAAAAHGWNPGRVAALSSPESLLKGGADLAGALQHRQPLALSSSDFRCKNADELTPTVPADSAPVQSTATPHQ
jgi:hypothetical protein